jgi:hypothetical protein
MSGTLTTTGSIDVNSLPSTPAGSNLIGQVELSDGTNPIGVTGNPLIVDGSAVTQPVSGTLAISNLPASQPVTGPLTDTELRASAVPVSGTFWQATQPVSGPLTDIELRATAVPVDASGATVPVSGPLTNTQLRASAIPVDASGTTVPVDASGHTVPVDASGHTVPVSGPLTNTELRATAVPVNGTLAISNFPATQPVSGTVTANIGTTNGLALDATLTGGAAKMQITDGAGHFLPTGDSSARSIHTTLDNSSIAVTGTFYQTTQPVSIAATVGVKQVPQTSGGLPLPFSASVNATKQQIKGSAGQIYGWQILNTTSAIAYVQVFDKTSANVTVGTTAPDYVIPLPPSGGATIEISQGITHANGITAACTTTRTGSTGAACDVLMFYA